MNARMKEPERSSHRLYCVNVRNPALVCAVAAVALLSAFGWISAKRGADGLLFSLACVSVLLAFGVLIIALVRIIELLKAIREELVTIRDRADTGTLDDIATELTAMRAQMRKGVFGLLGM